jgi:hypothetical protein
MSSVMDDNELSDRIEAAAAYMETFPSPKQKFRFNPLINTLDDIIYIQNDCIDISEYEKFHWVEISLSYIKLTIYPLSQKHLDDSDRNRSERICRVCNSERDIGEYFGESQVVDERNRHRYLIPSEELIGLGYRIPNHYCFFCDKALYSVRGHLLKLRCDSPFPSDTDSDTEHQLISVAEVVENNQVE